MNARSHALRALSLSALIIASGAVAAAEADSGQERSRADVVAETLAARAAGTLTPAGELSPGWNPPAVAHSTVSRSEVKSEVLTARRSGTLIPAGEGAQFAAYSQPHFSTITRAEVKASVIAARKAGELVPAGEGPALDEVHAHAKTASSTRTAESADSTTQVAKR